MNRGEIFKNYKSFDEAKEVWNKNVKVLNSDYVISYDEPKKEKDELLGVENIDDKEWTLFMPVLAVGEACSKTSVNDKIIINPSALMNQIPIIIDDCVFIAFSEKSIVGYLN